MSKQKQKYVIGIWNADGAFVPGEEQPDLPITDIKEMIAWARAEYKESAGIYSFVRMIPGTLEIAQQMTFFSKWGMNDGADTVGE